MSMRPLPLSEWAIALPGDADFDSAASLHLLFDTFNRKGMLAHARLIAAQNRRAFEIVRHREERARNSASAGLGYGLAQGLSMGFISGRKLNVNVDDDSDDMEHDADALADADDQHRRRRKDRIHDARASQMFAWVERKADEMVSQHKAQGGMDKPVPLDVGSIDLSDIDTVLDTLASDTGSSSASKPLLEYTYRIMQGQSALEYVSANRDQHRRVYNQHTPPVDGTLTLLASYPEGRSSVGGAGIADANNVASIAAAAAAPLPSGVSFIRKPTQRGHFLPIGVPHPAPYQESTQVVLGGEDITRLKSLMVDQWERERQRRVGVQYVLDKISFITQAPVAPFVDENRPTSTHDSNHAGLLMSPTQPHTPAAAASTSTSTFTSMASSAAAAMTASDGPQVSVGGARQGSGGAVKPMYQNTHHSGVEHFARTQQQHQYNHQQQQQQQHQQQRPVMTATMNAASGAAGGTSSAYSSRPRTTPAIALLSASQVVENTKRMILMRNAQYQQQQQQQQQYGMHATHTACSLPPRHPYGGEGNSASSSSSSSFAHTHGPPQARAHSSGAVPASLPRIPTATSAAAAAAAAAAGTTNQQPPRTRTSLSASQQQQQQQQPQQRPDNSSSSNANRGEMSMAQLASFTLLQNLRNR